MRYANLPLEQSDRIAPGEYLRIGQAIQQAVADGVPLLEASRIAAGVFNCTMAAAFTAYFTAVFTR